MDDWVRLIAPDRLERFLADVIGGRGPLVVEGRAQSGNSNITAFIRFGDEQLVVRRPPEGDLLPTSHDVVREVRFLSVMADTPVPVARVRALCEDPDVLGAPFYVMDRVNGVVLQDGEPEHLREPMAVRRLCDTAVDVLAAIHSVAWEGRSLPGRPGGYLRRQLNRWSGQRALTPSADRLLGLDEVGAWLKENLPEDGETTIVHGDFGFHNMILAGGAAPAIAAVLDWEMATLGDPIADLVWFLQGWGAADSVNPATYITRWPGAQSREQMLERYARQTGRSLRSELFYRIFSIWKGVVVTEGLYSAYLAGQPSTALITTFEHHNPAQVRKALALIEAG
jgi:aminoglycoside phosphotransferase (APT) family kinase protein